MPARCGRARSASRHRRRLPRSRDLDPPGCCAAWRRPRSARSTSAAGQRPGVGRPGPAGHVIGFTRRMAISPRLYAARDLAGLPIPSSCVPTASVCPSPTAPSIALGNAVLHHLDIETAAREAAPRRRWHCRLRAVGREPPSQWCGGVSPTPARTARLTKSRFVKTGDEAPTSSLLWKPRAFSCSRCCGGSFVEARDSRPGLVRRPAPARCAPARQRSAVTWFSHCAVGNTRCRRSLRRDSTMDTARSAQSRPARRSSSGKKFSKLAACCAVRHGVRCCCRAVRRLRITAFRSTLLVMAAYGRTGDVVQAKRTGSALNRQKGARRRCNG